MEAIAVVAIISTLAVFAAMSYQARRPSQNLSPDPLVLEIEKTEAYATILNALEKNSDDSLTWTIRNFESNAYVNARLIYKETNENEFVKCDAEVSLDFSQHKPGACTIRWSGELQHWCDRETAERIIERTTKWIELTLTGNQETVVQTLLSETPDDINSEERSEADKRAEKEFEKSLKRSLNVSPDPLQFDVDKEAAYAALLSHLKGNPIPAFTWTLIEKEENAYIIAELDFRETFEEKWIHCEAKINFDFSSIENSGCQIRWSGKLKNHYSREIRMRLAEMTSMWISMPFKTVTAEESQGRIEVIANRPASFAYSTLCNRIEATKQSGQDWWIVEKEEGQKIVAKVEEKDLGTEEVLFLVTITIEFEALARNRTSVAWFYDFLSTKDSAQAEKTETVINDWIRLVLGVRNSKS